MTTSTIDCEYVDGPADGEIRPAVVDPNGRPPVWRAVDAPDAMHKYEAERGDDGRWRYRWAGPLRPLL